MHMSDTTNYPLGYSEEEARRLARQGALLEEPTAHVLRRAGLREGMQVLDVGSGVGDVSLLAARLVGKGGSVLGIERTPSSVETARQRIAALGAENVAFAEGDLASFDPDRTFDAIIGRFILLYLPEPAAVLRRLLKHLRPGGIVAFQEYDMSLTSQFPNSVLFEKIRGYILKAFLAAGAELDMGTKLPSTFLRAGLPPPEMTAITLVGFGPSWEGYEYITSVVRSLVPLMERSGIASAAEIDIDTLADRLREDAIGNERVIYLPRLVGAWARSAVV
jgi:2-polyprenyl-3-methyl-5-hydroxy-6-metoxy-1,4-benzoquinol methylase